MVMVLGRARIVEWMLQLRACRWVLDVSGAILELSVWDRRLNEDLNSKRTPSIILAPTRPLLRNQEKNSSSSHHIKRKSFPNNLQSMPAPSLQKNEIAPESMYPQFTSRIVRHNLHRHPIEIGNRHLTCNLIVLGTVKDDNVHRGRQVRTARALLCRLGTTQLDNCRTACRHH